MPKIPEAQRLEAMLHYERPLWMQGLAVAGIDEVGRGPLAGPVVCACVYIDAATPLIHGINDSKRVSPARREKLFALICDQASDWALGIVEPEEIDRINILQATKRAMLQAVSKMHTPPQCLLVDALTLDTPIRQMSITHGDERSYLIAAASIAAKVSRDRMMEFYDKQYPAYGFAKHKGYGTHDHIQAILEHGPCPIHRRSFIKNYI